MFGVVAMLHGDVTRNTKVKVITNGASNELGFLENYVEWLANRARCKIKFLTFNALVTGTAHIRSCQSHLCLNVGCKGTRYVLLLFRLDHNFRGNGLGRAIDDFTVFNGPLNEPVLLVIARKSMLDTDLTEIKISIITNAAMPVSVGNGSITIIAAYREVGTGYWPHYAGKLSSRILKTGKLGAAALTSGDGAAQRRLRVDTSSINTVCIASSNGFLNSAKIVLSLLL